jgi:hypothetical protein
MNLELWTYGNTNTKLSKTERNTTTTIFNLTIAQHLAASRIMQRSIPDACAQLATPGCIQGCCVGRCGQGGLPSVEQSRAKKTELLFTNPPEFYRRFRADLCKIFDHCIDTGERCILRANTSSVVAHHLQVDYLQFSPVEFYDYVPMSAYFQSRKGWQPDTLPANYTICWSRKEHNTWQEVSELVSIGQSVAVVFHEGAPTEPGYCGRGAYQQKLPRFVDLPGLGAWPVVDGDISDLRCDDPPGVIVGLRLKSKEQRQRDISITTGFSVPVSAAPCIL